MPRAICAIGGNKWKGTLDRSIVPVCQQRFSESWIKSFLSSFNTNGWNRQFVVRC
jgi:hypothetical protein